MKSLFKIENIVQDILIRFPYTRDDNFILIYEVYMEINPLLLDKDFKYMLLNHRELSLPSFESIVRARRKIMEKNPSLNPSKRIKQLRNENEDYYKFYNKQS